MIGKLSTNGGNRVLASATALFLTLGLGTRAFAAEVPGPAATGEGWFFFIWLIAFLASIIALVQSYMFFKTMMTADEGTDLMKEIAGYVREGANAYLWQQYKIVTAFFVVIALLLAGAAYMEVQSRWVPFAFVTGGFFSALAGWFGMKTATWASNRTAASAMQSLNAGLQVAFRSGAVMGLAVVGLGLLFITGWFAILQWIVPLINTDYTLTPLQIAVTMLSFGMGASAQALFARVGGGIFTKAADVGADLVGKVEQGIPEDDPRNPATIADNVGDNVGDVAGMGADLFESYCGSILATSALGVAAYSTGVLLPAGMHGGTAQMQALLLPMVIAALGIVWSIVGVYVVRTEETATQKNLLAALGRGINLSTLLMAVSAVALSWWLMPPTRGTLVFGIVPGVAFSIIVGLVSGWLIGKWTEYATSDEYRPTKDLAAQSLTGPATVIIGGLASGMMSVWFPVLIVCGGMLSAFGFASGWNFVDTDYFALGLYGVGIAAVGMLSTLGIILATDAYGPIADNAGGNAEMAGLEKYVRQRTDALDSLGNTTAATGKGFAIGSAALTALALMAAYVEEVRQGFERWGVSAVHNELAADAPGFYKASPGFIIHKTDAQVPGTYLVMPNDLRDDRIAGPWQNIGFSSARPGRIPDDMLRIGEDGTVRFVESDAALIGVHDATLPAFTQFFDATVMNPKVLVGAFLGAMAVFVFCALTMQAVGRAAQGMVEEVRRQFREKPGIMAGTEKPDYASPVAISTKAAQREMMLPSILSLVLPIGTGLLLGVAGVLGLLVGTLTTGFCMAVFMANSGGSWDNAKKYIEGGAHGGKGTDPHKAAVVGDTVGDPFKDTSGPSLNILIKLMSMVSIVAAGLIVRYSLVALGVF